LKIKQRGVSENASYKVVALLITLILWVIILGSKEASVVKQIKTNFILPHDMEVTSPIPTEVSFRLTGPRLPLKRFSETSDPLIVDLSSALEGSTTIRIHPDSIDVPAGIHVIAVSPATITAKIEKVIQGHVPIEANLKGSLPKGYRLGRIIVEPSFYDFIAPRSIAEKIKKVTTTPIDLSLLKASSSQDVPLGGEEFAVANKGSPNQVRVNLEVKSK